MTHDERYALEQLALEDPDILEALLSWGEQTLGIHSDGRQDKIDQELLDRLKYKLHEYIETFNNNETVYPDDTY